MLGVTPEDLEPLLCMADMYAHKCTKQEEKFDYYRRNGIAWRWEDCEAAFELLRETGEYHALRHAWVRGELRTVREEGEG